MAAIKYVNSEGDSVPGVTTVLNNLGWKTEGLKNWAWKEGKAGRNYWETLNKAANAGTLAHKMIEADLKGFDPYKECYDEEIAGTDITFKADTAFQAWLKWKNMVNFKLVASELSCVSNLHQYGGTLDITMVMDKRSIIDIKTGDAIYADAKIQVSSYQQVYNECYPATPIEDCYILRLGKEDGSFSHHYYPDLAPHWECFKYLLEIHRLKKVIGK